MSYETADRIQELFAKEALSREAESLKRPRDWEELRDIRRRHDQERQKTEADYAQDYDTRIDTARQKIIADAGSRVKEHRPPVGVDRFSPERIEHLAHKAVQHAHAKDLMRIDHAEQRETTELIDKARARDAPRQTMNRNGQAFEAAAKPTRNRQR